MPSVGIQIDGKPTQVDSGLGVRQALQQAGVYIPGLCDHPELDAFKPFDWSEKVWRGDTQALHSVGDDKEYPHCGLCLVSIDGSQPVRSCDVRVVEGMEIRTGGNDIVAARRDALKRILGRHPHACLTCAQRHGCDRVQCSMNVPVSERCCELLGRCEIGAVSDWIGIPGDTPAYHNESRSSILNEPLFIRDYELCIGCTRCVRVCRDVRGVDVLGAVRVNGEVVVGTQLGPSLEESLCRFCGACVELCPTGALRDHTGEKPLTGDLAPCSARCPLEIDVPGYMGLIADGFEFEALELIRERAVLPGVLGYACFHPCEENCRRGSLDSSASICALKRYVSDTVGDQPASVLKLPSTGKKVAVIGGGPAGIAAAAELLRLGHDVTLLEREKRLGGMLRQTLPDFRLPDEVIDRDLVYLYSLGLNVKTGVELGRDFTPESLTEEGYSAVIVAIGLGSPARLGVTGESEAWVIPGLELLRAAAGGAPIPIAGSVVVIGGGSVAVDAAMVARRSGAERVTMVCLESPDEMPAHKDELQYTIDEGTEIMNSWGVVAFESPGNDLHEIVLKRCLSVFDERGRFSPKFNEETTLRLKADFAVVAIGQRRSGVAGTVTERPGLFMAGDLTRGPSSIVEAMADGRRTAFVVDKYLGGKGETVRIAREKPRASIGRDSQFHSRSRSVQVTVPATDRLTSMTPFIPGLSTEQARNEAARCLRCHLRASLAKSRLPPDPWKVFGQELVAEAPTVEGVIILADDEKKTIRISGGVNIRAILEQSIDEGVSAVYCRWEIDPMFTKRESEMIQAHLQTHGEMPGAGDLDDLF